MSVAEAPIFPAPVPHRWTVNQFMALLAADAFEEGWRAELLDGAVVTQTPPGREHDFAYEALHLAFAAKGLYFKGVIPMLKFIVRERSALEPDFARYRAESVGRYGNKEAAYAAVGAPDYWVIDVEHRAQRMFSKPVEGVHTEERLAHEGEIVALPGLDATLDTGGLFPPEA